MSLDKNDFKQMRRVFNEGFTQLVLPNLDKIYKKLDEHSKILGEHSKTLNEHSKILDYHSQDLDRIERKLDAEIDWRDDASKRIKNLELKINLK